MENFQIKIFLDKLPFILYKLSIYYLRSLIMPVTLKDIAEELNLSVNAVSRALRNMSDIGPETTKLVQETAQKLGYRKNLAASYLKTAKSMMFGIIVPDICNPVFSYMYKGIEKICNQTDYTLMLGNSNENSIKENKLIDNMVAHGVDGIFIVPSKESDAIYPRIEQANIPCVLLQRKGKDQEFNFVQSNDYEGGYLAAKHLYSLGHRMFLLVFTDMQISSARERYNGFCAFLKEQNVDKSNIEVLVCDSTRAGGYEVMNDWLNNQKGKKLSANAIFCFSDYIAYGVYSALFKNGFNIPDDVSVIGYDNNEYSDIIHPKLTTIDILPYDIGKHSAKLMLDLIENDKLKSKGIVITPTLTIKESAK